jgi:hypothetical protein
MGWLSGVDDVMLCVSPKTWGMSRRPIKVHYGNVMAMVSTKNNAPLRNFAV